MRRKFPQAACAAAASLFFLCFGSSSASATVFDVTGVLGLSGTVDIDTIGGTLNGVNLSFINSPPNYTNIVFAQEAGGVAFVVEAANGLLSPADIILLNIENDLFGGSLVGYTGGHFGFGFLTGCNLDTLNCGSFVDLTTDGALLVAEALPIPAALPLFATGLGALGLLGLRRRRRPRA